MMRVWLGYDPVESVAYHVASHSIISRTRNPVQIAPVGNTVLPPDMWWRGRGEHDSTEFSNARFMVPYLAGYKGWALFMDCDVLCLEDLASLWAYRDPRYAVMVCKQDHEPLYAEKFLGAKQIRYQRKNWSSVMLLNCEHHATRSLTTRYVNEAPGLDLHTFQWCEEGEIGPLPNDWNVLVEHGRLMEREPMLAHYTQGGPWFGHLNQACTAEWIAELIDMVAGANPRASARAVTGTGSMNMVVTYEQDTQVQS